MASTSKSLSVCLDKTVNNSDIKPLSDNHSLTSHSLPTVCHVLNSSTQNNDDNEEDDDDDAEKAAQEVLSPRPPPDDIGPEELAALVVAGPSVVKGNSSKSSGSSSPAGSTQHLSSSAALLLELSPNVRNSVSALVTLATVSDNEVNAYDSPTSITTTTTVITTTQCEQSQEQQQQNINAIESQQESTPVNSTEIIHHRMSFFRRLFTCVGTSRNSSEYVNNNNESAIITQTPSTGVNNNHNKKRSSPLLCSCISAKNGSSGGGGSSTYGHRKKANLLNDKMRHADHASKHNDSSAAVMATGANRSHHFSQSGYSTDAAGNGRPNTPLLPPITDGDQNKKCFVIDLDETLVHSSFAMVPNAHFKIGVDIEGKVHQVYVLKRPYVDVFLQKMASLYECVLFTASLSKYADPVTDFIDPDKVFRHRLFRESCCLFNGNYVKDLSQLGRDVNQTVILDNSPVSYLFHTPHAVHILSWFDNPDDHALLDLIPFFEALAVAPDVPSFLARYPPPASATGISPLIMPNISPTTILSFLSHRGGDASSSTNANNNNNTRVGGSSNGGGVGVNGSGSSCTSPPTSTLPSSSSDTLSSSSTDNTTNSPSLMSPAATICGSPPSDGHSNPISQVTA